MRGHHAVAGSHIRSGARLLQETLDAQQRGILQREATGIKPQSDFYIPLEILTSLFAGLDNEIAKVRLSSQLDWAIRAVANLISRERKTRLS